MDAKPRPDKKAIADGNPSSHNAPRKSKALRLQENANLLGLVTLGVHVLGRALITRHDRQNFTVHELEGGLYHVSEVDGRFVCSTCREAVTDPDRHAALVLLYVLAIEGGPLGRRA